MSKDEIKLLIESTINGQGNQIDTGGKLGAILNAIVDSIPDSPEPAESVVFDFTASSQGGEINQADYEKAKKGLGIRRNVDALPVITGLSNQEYNLIFGAVYQRLGGMPEEVTFFGRIRFNIGTSSNVYGECYALAKMGGRYLIVPVLN